ISSISSEARLRKRKAKSETTAERIDPMTATVRLAGENHQPFSALWRFEQGQASMGHYLPHPVILSRRASVSLEPTSPLAVIRHGVGLGLRLVRGVLSGHPSQPLPVISQSPGLH